MATASNVVATGGSDTPTRKTLTNTEPYTTFQQLAFAPQFPLVTIADECVIPPSYPSVLKHQKEFETIQSDTCPPYQPFTPPGLPVPATTPPSKWYYKDPKGILQGPWKASLMQSWFQDGLLPLDLPVRREDDTEFTLLKDLRQLSLDPTRPFHPNPSHTTPQELSQQALRPHPAESLLPPVSLLAQLRQYGPPALFFTSRGGHSTSIVDVRGKPVLKGRFMWTPDASGERHVYAPLGDVKRLELFDVKDKAVIVALRQTGLEITYVADGLHQQEDTNNSDPLQFNQQSRRRHFIHRVGTELVDETQTQRPSTATSTTSPKNSISYFYQTKSERLHFSMEELWSEDELLFLGRNDDTIYLCEKCRGHFRFLCLRPRDL